MQKAMAFNNVAIVSVRGSDYSIRYWCVSNYEATYLLKKCCFKPTKWSIIWYKLAL